MLSLVFANETAIEVLNSTNTSVVFGYKTVMGTSTTPVLNTLIISFISFTTLFFLLPNLVSFVSSLGNLFSNLKNNFKKYLVKKYLLRDPKSIINNYVPPLKFDKRKTTYLNEKTSMAEILRQIGEKT